VGGPAESWRDVPAGTSRGKLQEVVNRADQAPFATRLA
jgi:hypothetical protein